MHFSFWSVHLFSRNPQASSGRGQVTQPARLLIFYSFVFARKPRGGGWGSANGNPQSFPVSCHCCKHRRARHRRASSLRSACGSGFLQGFSIRGLSHGNFHCFTIFGFPCSQPVHKTVGPIGFWFTANHITVPPHEIVRVPGDVASWRGLPPRMAHFCRGCCPLIELLSPACGLRIY